MSKQPNRTEPNRTKPNQTKPDAVFTVTFAFFLILRVVFFQTPLLVNRETTTAND